MIQTAHPLREKLVLFWHDHFATSVLKVRQPALMARQNILIREPALGKFGPFLLEMSRDPAMLIWLDSNSNTRGRPNENYARELMELFSLGVGHYAEADVREAARLHRVAHRRAEVHLQPGPARRGLYRGFLLTVTVDPAIPFL